MWGALLAGALSGAGSLLGGLGASSAAKKQARYQQIYDAAARESNANLSKEMLSDVPVRVARDAEVAGFNPVTWLQGGALGFYSNAYGHRATTASQANYIPSALEAFGSGLTSAVGAYQKQANFESNQALQSSMLDRQLSAIGGKPSARPSSSTSLGVQSALGGAGGALIQAGSAIAHSGAGGLSAGGSVLDGFPTWWRADKSSPSAQVVSDRYGEGGEWVSGAWNALNDGALTLTGKSIPDRFKADAAKSGADMTDFWSTDPSRNWKFLYEWNVPKPVREYIDPWLRQYPEPHHRVPNFQGVTRGSSPGTGSYIQGGF